MADADFSVKAIISAQTSQFEKGIKNAQSSINTMSKSIEGVQKLLKSAFSIVGIGVSIKAVTDFGRSCVQSATQAQKAFNILDNTVKATGADAWTSIENLESASKALSDSTNYSVTEIQKMQSVLLGFTNITGEAFDGASEAVLDMATVMGMDLTSAVQAIGKALDDPITGLDSLRRQGFKFTDEQKAELTQLVKNGKQLEAQKIILDTLATSYGGAAKAGQDSFAKQRHAIENFKDTLGGKLISVMQVFAENSAKTLNNLTNLISKMDFTPLVNVITNLNKIFASAFQNISNYFKNIKDEVTDFISRFNFEPIVSVLDTLIGVLVGVNSKFKEINSQKLEVFDKLKETFIDFSNSETFQNIVNFINKIIDAVFFLWSEVQDINMEIRNLVINKIIEIWGKIKELFQNGQNALSQSGQDIASWGDLFYDILNNAFRIFQDFFGMIKALIHGDWSVAWEYAKLTVMRVADSILDLISTIANAFPNLINGMIEELNKLITEINKVRGWFGKDPLGLISAFESVDLSKKSGLEDKIKETENKIEELTGQAADVAIKDLQGVSVQFAGFTQHALGEIEKLTDGVATETKKQKKYFSSATSSGESSYEKFSEWDSKLLQQRLEGLSDWSDEAHEINLQLIEEERKKALEADKTGADTEKINKYYNKKIEQENERAEESKRDMIKQTALIAINQLKSIASNAVAVFKKVASTIKNAFSGIVNIFTKIFEFNPDDALDNLLKVEDAILTFFVETLPKLPGFFSSAIESIIKLIDALMNVIDWNQIVNILNNIVDVIIKNAPTIIKNLLVVAENIIKSVLEALKNFVKSGGWKMLLDLLLTIQITIEQIVIDNMDDIVNTIINMLPDLIETLKNSIVSASRTLGKLAPKILPMIAELINAIVEVITSDEVIDSANEAVEGIVEGLVKAIIKLLPNAIMKILNMAIKLANPQRVGKLVVAIVKGLVKAFAKINWLEVVKECFMGFIEGFKELFGIHSPSTLFEGFGFNIVEGLVNGLKGILEAVMIILQPFADMVTSLFSSMFGSLENIVNISFGGITATVEVINRGVSLVISSLSEGLASINNSFANIINSVANLVKQLVKLIQTVNEATNSLNPFRGGSSGGSSGGSYPGQGTVFDPDPRSNPLTRRFFGHAIGTNNAPAGLAIVGEAGPELVKFRGGEQVLNNRNTNKALAEMGKATNNFNVTFNNLQDTTAFAMMKQLKQYNRELAFNGVL